MIQSNEQLKTGIRNKTALFGTVDSWLLTKLRSSTGEHLTDITNATATGFFDPFMGDWAGWSFAICGIVKEMLPRVVANDSPEFGVVDASLFGHAIPIRAIMGDQPAALWGSTCFEKGDLKVTLGTGSFLDLNTGETCHASIHGLYPMVAWKVMGGGGGDSLVYLMEGGSSDTGSLIKWAQSFGLFEEPRESAAMAFSVPDPDGVFFIPAFSGLGVSREEGAEKSATNEVVFPFNPDQLISFLHSQPPVNDHQAATGMLGIRPSTKSAHIVRAILESIVFRVIQLLRCSIQETNFRPNLIRVDGGVSQNDFVCQMIADISGVRVERAVNSDASAIGVAFIAGVGIGMWTSRDELVKMRKIDRVFEPDNRNGILIGKRMTAWERALDRFKGWYGHEDMGNK